MDAWSIFTNSLTALVILIVTWIIYDFLSDLAWMKKYNLRGPFPWPLLKGLPRAILKDFATLENEDVKQYGPVSANVFGAIRGVNIFDIDLLKKIFMKDHVKFQNRYSMEELDVYPVGHSLLSLKDDEWKRVRSILTPSFSSAKIKQMVPEINYCGGLLSKSLEDKAKAGEAIDVRKHYGCYTMDVIASTAFGLRTDAYSHPEEKFVSLAQKVFGQSQFGPSMLFASKTYVVGTQKNLKLMVFFPRLAGYMTKYLGFSAYYPLDSLNFFSMVIKDLINDRKTNENKNRVDLLQQMIDAELNDEAGDTQTRKKLDIHELLGQGFLLFVAGYETTASLLSYLTYLLALHPDIQKKLVDEIDKHIQDTSTDITYDNVNELKYLDQVINETLRFYPPVARINRATSNDQDVEIDGHWFPANTVLQYSIYYFHRSPEFYPEPEEFKPERFSPEEKAKRDPFVFMPFGHGPRNCIGMRLALLEAKMGIIHALKKVTFVKSTETEVPLQLVNETLLKPKHPIKVAVQLR